MAITRAQQVKQMLREGGRIGLKPGGPPGGGATSMGSGRDYSKSTASTTPDRDDSPQTDRIIDLAKRKKRQDLKDLATRQAEDKKEELVEKFRNKQMQDSNLPGLLGMGIKFLEKPLQAGMTGTRNFVLNKVIDAKRGMFKDIDFYSLTPQEQEEVMDKYMSARMDNTIDAYGNPIGGGGRDDPFIPINQMSTNMNQANMDQASTEELSPIQQAILDRGIASAFLATGGRVGFKGGADMGTVSTDTRKATAKSVDISPSGNVTTSRDRGPDPVDDRSNERQNAVQAMVRAGLTPKEIRSITNPNVIDRVRRSRFNNPVTRGLGMAGLYATNPTLAGFKFRDLMKAKNLVDTTITGSLPNTDTDESDILRSNLITDTQKDVIDKQMKIGELTGAFDPDQTFEAAKGVFDEETGTYGFDDKGEKNLFSKDRPAEPMTREEFDAYVRENRTGGGPVGGIMDLESGRQMYFLGKLVKKATRAVKKIAKSPIGKAALLYAGGSYLSGLGALKGLPKAGFLNPENKGFMDLLFKGGKISKGLTGGGKLALGGALTLAPLLFQEDTNEDDYQKFLAERGAGAQLPAPMVDIRNKYRDYMATAFLADGGRPEPVAKKTMPLLDMDGKEMDFRAEGGFVPIGRMERADDVPARLSKNEFVFTADAVRNAGEGDIDKGAEVMYNMMKNLESGGDVSEESQGLDGAREMFKTSQRLEEVI